MKNFRSERPQVVVVDDDPDFLEILRQWLSSRYDTVSLKDGAELLEELPGLEPDLVILDVNLPGPDGFRLCRRIRSEARMAGIPILFLTASRSNQDFLKNLEVGGSAYLTKPVERQRLLTEVYELIGRA